jgi:serine/threonine protein kinase
LSNSDERLWQGKLPDGQEVAVKKLLDSATGHGLLQLHNELQVLATLQHKNLVRLHGFCVHQNQKMLVYEYIKNGSLDNFLFGIFSTSLAPFCMCIKLGTVGWWLKDKNNTCHDVNVPKI